MEQTINIESIFKHGLKLPGTKLENGKIIPITKLIPREGKTFYIKNWENAIFASPNLYGAIEYSNNISGFYCVFEVLIKPGSFTTHKLKTLIDHYEGHGICKDVFLNYDIFRISSERNIIFKSILFVDRLFRLYYLETENPQEQKMLLKKYGFQD